MAIFKGIIAYMEAVARLNGEDSGLQYPSDAEVHWQVPKGLGKGYVSAVRLRPGMENQLPAELDRIARGDTQAEFYREMPAATTVQTVLQDIFARPYHGPFQRMFLESKGIELMTHTLWRICRQQTVADLAELRPEYVERVRNAKHFIDRHYYEDINLRGLARQVGLHHSKLSLLFQMLYDTTVFGYVRQLRLNQACFLLSEGNTSVTEVALAVGYANLSHFAKVFKAHWGRSPSGFCRRPGPSS